MEYSRAKHICDEIVRYLSPVCERIEIAGSVRRRVRTVNDLEIVCIPKCDDRAVDMFGMAPPARHPDFIRRVEKLGTPIRGKAEGRWRSIQGKEITLDLFMCNADNWGYIYALRTGSKRFSHEVLARGWVARGYKGIDGNLVKISTGQIIQTPEEQDLFRLIGIQYVSPERRC